MLVFFAIVILLLVMVLTFIVRPLMWPSAAVKVDDGADEHCFLLKLRCGRNGSRPVAAWRIRGLGVCSISLIGLSFGG